MIFVLLVPHIKLFIKKRFFAFASMVIYLFLLLVKLIFFTFQNKIANCRGASDAVQVIQSLCPADLSKKVFLKDVIEDFYKKILAFMDYTEPPIGLQSNFVLYRPKQVAVRDVKNDYELSACSSKHVPVTYLDGDHQTILEHQDIVIKINELLNKL